MEQQDKKKTNNGTLRLRQTILVLLDIVVFVFCSYLGLLLRFEFDLDELVASGFLVNISKLLPLTAIACTVILGLFGLYNSLWEFAGERELVKIVAGCFVAALFQITAQFMFQLPVPRSIVLIQFLLLAFAVAGIRFSYRFLRREKKLYLRNRTTTKRTMIIGAGEAGAMVLRELQRSELSQNHVVCLMDDDRQKIGKSMYNVPIVGSVDDIIDVARQKRIEEIILAIPSASAKRRSEILDICSQTQCHLRILPGIYQLINGEVSIQKIRDVQIEDLLARQPIDINSHAVFSYYAGKRVLITGGGGSIGSELCRQIAKCSPSQLVILDIYENNAYDIQQELVQKYGKRLNLAVEIASVRDRERLEAIFAHYRPEIIFHAAAHKHVPLMEHSACEAVKNNVMGTYHAADMAEKYGAEKFILISTDKAVNPTNVMGATKRVCETIIQCRNDSATSFAAVRFGNVLGSNGSVIPLFKRQIANGGPVTITDKRIIRYFMTISEASQLVIEAGAMAKKGELFVLDMGKPVKIYDLAVNMIRLSGMEPEVDIPIQEIGLRPGEKLYEELLIQSEQMEKTANDLIYIEHDKPLTRQQVECHVRLLLEAAKRDTGCLDSGAVAGALTQVVPTFQLPEEVNKNAERSAEMQLAGMDCAVTMK